MNLNEPVLLLTLGNLKQYVEYKLGRKLTEAGFDMVYRKFSDNCLEKKFFELCDEAIRHAQMEIEL